MPLTTSSSVRRRRRPWPWPRVRPGNDAAPPEGVLLPKVEDVPIPDEQQRPPIFRRHLVVAALEPFTDVVHEHLGALGCAACAFALAVQVVIPQEQLLEVEAAQEGFGGLSLRLDADHAKGAPR